MSFIESIYEKAKQNKQRVAVPECINELMMRSCAKASKEGIADIVFLGDTTEINRLATEREIDISTIEIVDTGDEEYKAELLARYDALPQKVLSTKSAGRRISQPLYMAMVMEVVGDIDITFAGLDTTTSEYILGANGIIGMADGVVTPSALMLLEVHDFEGGQGKIFGMSDGAICVEPTAEQHASIAISCCESFAVIVGKEAKCAFLSLSTDGSATGGSIERIQQAVKLARTQRPDLKIDGEFQTDAAIVKRVGQKKVARPSDVAGEANVLIFPDAAACNIGSKLVQILANCTTYGPIYQGFRLPILDCSRSDTESRIFDNIALCSGLAAYQRKLAGGKNS